MPLTPRARSENHPCSGSASLPLIRLILGLAVAREPPEERARQARDTVRESGAYELRHQLQLCAPTEMLALTEQVHAGLRDLREQALNGVTSEKATYPARCAAYEAAARVLREAMRRDLDVAPGQTSATVGPRTPHEDEHRPVPTEVPRRPSGQAFSWSTFSEIGQSSLRQDRRSAIDLSQPRLSVSCRRLSDCRRSLRPGSDRAFVIGRTG